MDHDLTIVVVVGIVAWFATIAVVLRLLCG
jgi:hypothetical protein